MTLLAESGGQGRSSNLINPANSNSAVPGLEMAAGVVQERSLSRQQASESGRSMGRVGASLRDARLHCAAIGAILAIVDGAIIVLSSLFGAKAYQFMVSTAPWNLN